MIEDEDSQIIETNFLSDVLGDVGVDEKQKKHWWLKIKGLVKKCVYERIVSKCEKLGDLIHNMVGRYMTVLSQREYDNSSK